MVIYTIPTSDCTPQTIVIGRRTTYGTLQVVFDLSYLAETYGSGAAVLVVKRSQDTTAYPAVVSQADNILTWMISDVDTYYVGSGECQLMWYVEGGLAKTIIYPMVVMRDILTTSEEAPDAYQTWVDDLTALGAETLQNAQDAAQSASDAEQAKDDAVEAKEAAEAALEEFTTPTASATSLAPSAEATASYSNGHFSFGIPRGEQGAKGDPGEKGDPGSKGDPGNNGFSPTITVADITGGHRVTITDVNGTRTVDVMNGTNGTDGTDGEDGYSPVVTITDITDGHRVTITDKTHPSGQSFDVMDGQDGASDAGEVTYDETATYPSGSVGAALTDQKNAISELNRQLSDVESAITNLEKSTIYTVELDTFWETVPFFVNAGDTVSIKSADGSAMTVGQIRFVRSDGSYDYWTIQNQTERKITMSENFVGVFISNGTVQEIVVTNESSPANYHTETDQLTKDVELANERIEKTSAAVGITEPEFAVVDGYFIATSGSKTASAPFVYSNPIAVNKGTVISLVGAGYNTNVAMISTCLQDGTGITPRVICNDSNVNKYEYTTDADGYIIVCYNKNTEHDLTLNYDRIGFIDEKINYAVAISKVTPTELNNGLIHRDGRIMDASNFRYTNPIRLENEVIEFTARGYTNIVSLLSLCDEDGGNRINVVNSTDDEPTKNISYTSNGVSFVIICSNVSVPISYTTTKLNTVFDEPYVSLPMFQKFGVVGDSYASGALFYDNKEKDDYAHSWGQILARKLGTVCTNYSRGGLSTRTWLIDSKGLPLVLASEAEEIYYLALGINDFYSLGASYLGTITDITSHSVYADYPDTFYGNYGKIIEQIQNHAPHGKLIMFTIAGIGENAVRDSYNDAIIEIANHYSIPYIVQNDDQFFLSDFYNQTKVEGHPIAITYSGMAEAFERLLISCIRNNVAYFKNTFWYD